MFHCQLYFLSECFYPRLRNPKVPDEWQRDYLSNPVSEIVGKSIKLPDAFLRVILS
jgi:hypothetical protein